MSHQHSGSNCVLMTLVNEQELDYPDIYESGDHAGREDPDSVEQAPVQREELYSMNSGWILTRVYYYDEKKEPLLLNCIRPLLHKLQQEELIEQGYFLRHWLRGPHIRLYLRTHPEQLEQLKTVIREETRSYFARQPSQRILHEEEIRAMHTQLAELEKVDEPLFPLQPDNSVTFEEVAIDADLYGGEIGLKLAHLFYARCTPLVLRLLEYAEGDREVRLAQMFHWMLITVAHLGGGLRMAYISYRSHSEGFLHGFDSNGKIRQRFEQQYEQKRADWERNVQHYLNPAYLPVDELDAAWNDMLEAFLPYLRHAITDQDLRMAIPEINLDRMSTFHQESFKLPWMSKFMTSHHYTIRRLLLNLIYEVMLQIGIRPIEKMFLCYSVARAVEEVTGVSWREFQEKRDELVNAYPVLWGKSVPWPEA